jgi:hypothetical protein
MANVQRLDGLRAYVSGHDEPILLRPTHFQAGEVNAAGMAKLDAVIAQRESENALRTRLEKINELERKLHGKVSALAISARTFAEINPSATGDQIRTVVLNELKSWVASLQ